MTIISHSHKFIFIKSRKVASSSLLVALGQHCSGEDIITSPGDTEGYPNYSAHSSNLRTHMHPLEIQQLVTPSQWKEYTKITSVRNPWDVAVSMLLWRFYRGGARWGVKYSESFKKAINTQTIDLNDLEYRSHMQSCIDDIHRNCDFYFMANGSAYADFHVRYESLQTDFNLLCEKLSLPTSTLPSLKSKSRNANWRYQNFFDEELRDKVYIASKKSIDYFNYQF